MPDRAAIVTGASSGIGLAFAHVQGEEGYGVTVAARGPEKVTATADELRANVQTKRVDMQLDVNLRAIILFHRECSEMPRAAGAEPTTERAR